MRPLLLHKKKCLLFILLSMLANPATKNEVIGSHRWPKFIFVRLQTKWRREWREKGRRQGFYFWLSLSCLCMSLKAFSRAFSATHIAVIRFVAWQKLWLLNLDVFLLIEFLNNRVMMLACYMRSAEKKTFYIRTCTQIYDRVHTHKT